MYNNLIIILPSCDRDTIFVLFKSVLYTALQIEFLFYFSEQQQAVFLLFATVLSRKSCHT